MLSRLQCVDGATIPTGAIRLLVAIAAAAVVVMAATACDHSPQSPIAIPPAPDPATVSKLSAVTPIGHDVQPPITVMAVSADGTHLAAATANHTVIVWRIESFAQCVRVGEFPAEAPISAVALSPNGDRVMAVSAGRARIFTTASAAATPAMLLEHPSPIGNSIFLGSNDHLLTASGETLVRWSMQTNPHQPFLPHRVADEDTPIVAVTASADGRFVLFATPVDAERMAVCLIAFDDNFATPRMRDYHLFGGPSNESVTLAFSADGQTAIAARGSEWMSFDLTAENPSMAVRRFSLTVPETADAPTPRAFRFVTPFAQRFYVAVDGSTVWRLDPTAESPATAIGSLPVPQPTQSLAGIGIAGQGRWLIALIDGNLHGTTIE